MRSSTLKADRLFTGLVFAIGLLFSTSTYAQQKHLLWMHGLAGEKAGGADFRSFGRYFDYYSPAGTKSFVPNSGADTKYDGVSSIATDIKHHMDDKPDGFKPNDKVIFIGHSMGGLVGKELDIRHNRRERNGMKFHGIITMGSPLSGAKVANSLESPRYPNWRGGSGSPVYCLAVEATDYMYSSTFIPVISHVLSAFTRQVGILAWSIYAIFNDPLPVGGQSWQDLKVGSKGHAHRRNVATSTPKIHIWGNVQRPVFAAMAKKQDFNGVYQSVIHHAGFMADTYRWVGMRWQATRSMRAKAYFKYTLNGRYANLISDGVSYSTRYSLIRTWQQAQRCYTQSIRNTSRRCRSWGWFSWVCFPFVWFTEIWVCTMDFFWANSFYWYQVPHYPDSDGVVSKSSATAQGQRWGSRVKVKAKETDHIDLTTFRGQADNVLEAIFNGSSVELNDKKPEFTKVFKLSK